MASTARSGTDGTGGPVLVGIDSSDPSRAALAWAVRYAEQSGAALRAVAVWQQPSAIGRAEWFPQPEYERDAAVLVLGSSRRGGVAGARLGSVGLHCAHHATCPLVLVPQA